MIQKIKTYFHTKNSYGFSRKDQIINLIKSTKVSFWKRKLEKDSIFNIFFVIRDLQGDIDINFVVCVLGRSVKIKWYCYVDWWKDNRSPHIIYWKMIGKRYWEK